MINYPQHLDKLSAGLLKWILDLIFPIRCFSCGKFGRYVCKKCLRTIPINKNFECINCRRPVHFGITCSACTEKNYVDQLLVAVDYKNPLVQKTLKAFKYRFISDVNQPILILLKNYFKWLTLKKNLNIFQTNPLFVPVPLHSRRLNWRGFNQAEILAKDLASTFQMQFDSEVLKRVRRRMPQADIKDKKERIKNLKGVFKIIDKEKIVSRDVILVDDVCTTGTTLNECARILKESGAKRVTALVVAGG